MFEQISMISTISMILSPDECSPKCPSPYIYTHPPLNCYSRTQVRGTLVISLYRAGILHLITQYYSIIWHLASPHNY